MLSTLRASTARLTSASRLLSRSQPLPCIAAQATRLFSGGSDEQKPPKGFEKFNRAAKSKADKTKNSKEQVSSKEAGNEGPKENSQKAKSEKKSGAEPLGSESTGYKWPDGTEVTRETVAAVRIGALTAAFLAYSYFQGEEPEQEITVQELMREHLSKGHVQRIQIINRSIGLVQLRHDASGEFAGRDLRIQLGTPESFEAKIEQLQLDLGLSPLDFVPIQYVNETDFVADFVMPMLPWVLTIFPLLFFGRMMSGMGGGGLGGGGGAGGRNMFSMGKAMTNGQKDLKSTVKFSDVAGMEQAKKEVVEFVDFLKAPEKYEKLGARIPKGGLLVGPPGTGKTLLAKAVAGEADCPFFSMSGSDFVEMFVGVGPSRVRDLFKQAREKAPSIIFIDEIDAIGKKRGSGMNGGGNDERENTLNQFLVEMDGFSSTTGVVVLAGTNRADVLDPALKRPGRFDRQIQVDRPDIKERKAIFMVHLKPISTSEGLDKESIAQRMSALTPGFAGADIANICNEAAIFAARRSAKAVEMVDFEKATERVMGGLPKENGLMSQAERRTVALHEAGHALAGWFLEHSDPLLKVSIVPRSNGALGFAQYLPEEMALHSQEAILDKIAMALGGRAAEELFVGRISTGAQDDLDKVTKMAYAMVSLYGMNPKLGLVSFNQNDGSQQFYKPYSDATGQIIDTEAKLIIDAQYSRIKRLLDEKKDLVHSLADSLLTEDTLVYSQIVKIFGERPHGIKEQYKQFVTASGNPFTDGVTKKVDESEIKEGIVPPPSGSSEASASLHSCSGNGRNTE